MNRIDAHHHLWSIARGDYGWLDPVANPALAPIARDFLLDEFRALAAAHGISGSILVQAAATRAETDWLLGEARRSNGLVLGVIGWLDLAAPDAPETIETMSRDPLLRGIRPMLQDLPDPEWILRPEVQPALRAAARANLALDLLVRGEHLPAALRLLERHPGLRAVVDHAAKPAIAGGAWSPWAEDLRRLARETAVACKLSGLWTEAAPGTGADALRRYIDHLLECFGPERLIWGSDWPVMTLATSYGGWIRAVDGFLGGLDESGRQRILAGNALAFYAPAAPGSPGGLTPVSRTE